jgi:DnaJ-class molecular chaperone
MLQLRYLDHYRLLKIAPIATPAEVELAYKTAVAQLPRDWTRRLLATLQGKTERHFAMAYKELIDPSARGEYDAYLSRVNDSPPFLIF